MSGMSLESPEDRRQSISDILNNQTVDRRGQKRVLGAESSLDKIEEDSNHLESDRPPTLAEQLAMQAKTLKPVARTSINKYQPAKPEANQSDFARALAEQAKKLKKGPTEEEIEQENLAKLKAQMTKKGYDLEDEANNPSKMSKDQQLKLTSDLLKGDVSDSLRRVSKLASGGGVSQTLAMANLTKRIQQALQANSKKSQKSSRRTMANNDDSDESFDSVDLSDYESDSDA